MVFLSFMRLPLTEIFTMKNITTLFILFIALTFNSKQASGQSFINVHLGFSLSNLANADIDTGNKLALTPGLGFEFWINDKIGFEPSIDYVPKGANLGVVANVTKFSYRLNYWDVTAFAKYKAFYNPGFHLNIIGGPSYSRIANARERFFRIATLTTTDIPEGDAGIQTSDFGLNLGTELNIPTEYGYLSLRAYYQYGFGNILQIVDSSVVSTRLLNIGLVFKIRTKKLDPEGNGF